MTALKPCEISWFSALCDDDYEFLGVPDAKLRSSWEHCRDIVMQAEAGGFDNILLPSGYALGLDTTAFAAAIAPMLKRIRLLMAVRIGEMWLPQLARQIGTIDRMLGGRLAINIISSDLPGETLASAPRYRRTVEAMAILKQLLNGEAIDHQGEFYQLKLAPARMGTLSGKAPQLYFGGLSPDAREAAAAQCDVFLMWPDKREVVEGIIADMTARAAELITTTGKASTSMLQTKLKVGFNRASRLMDDLERFGIVGPQDPRNPAVPRHVYGPDNWLRGPEDVDDPYP